MKTAFTVLLLAASAAAIPAADPSREISGDYLEVRSCDVYTGYCFANSEMNLAGKEATLLWSVREGAWKGTPLEGLSVMAVLKADGTLGDVKYEPRAARAVLIVDEKADVQQQFLVNADFE